MSDSAKCPRCQAELPADFPPGVCPACLMQQGLSNSTFMGSVDSAGGGTRSRSGRRHRWTPPTPEEIAPRFAQLEIVELLGQGGMGAVYKVRQKELDRWAALKILPDDVADDPNFSERFQREARALALLGHQHIVIVYEFGQRDGVYFLLMEYIDGVTLRQAIRAGQIAAKDALGIVAQICDALQFAHEEGVVHRDIKPENILIDKRSRVKIADFGLAKMLSSGSVEVPTLTGTHQVMGTPMYMAPEQMEGTRGVDHRADIFSLGVVFYELLTGELPLGRFAPPSQKYRLDVRLDEVVLRTLEKEPDRRYQQASDVKCDVESIRSQPVSAITKGQPSNRRFWDIRKLAYRIAGTVLLALLCGLFFLAGEIHNKQRVEQERERIQAIAASREVDPKLDKLIRQERERAQAIAAREQFLQGKRQVSQKQKSGLETSLAEPWDDTSAENEKSTEPEDPYEAASIVQFTTDGPKLNPRFGNQDLTPPQREIVNRILAKVHRAYLTQEAEKTLREDQDPANQVIVILGIPAEQIARLKNELWTAIDTKLPLDQQRLLRRTLPLFADNSSPSLLLDPNNNVTQTPYPFGAPVGMSGMGMGAPMMMGAPGGYMPGMGGGKVFSNSNGQILRYPQLLGWKSELFPLRITIGRKGKWFDWSIHATSGESQYLADSGEAPELPTGLRRFWKDASEWSPPEQMDRVPIGSGNMPDSLIETTSPDAEPTVLIAEPPVAEELPVGSPNDDLSRPIEARATPAPYNSIIFENDQPKLSPNFGGATFTDDDRKFVDDILARTHRAFLDVERRHTRWEMRQDGSQVSVVSGFANEIEKLENDLWTSIDERLSIEKQTVLRKHLQFFGYIPGPETTLGTNDSLLTLPTILGWDQTPPPKSNVSAFPMKISIRRQGQWYHWTIDVDVIEPTPEHRVMGFRRIDEGRQPELPIGIRRFWRQQTEAEKSNTDTPSQEASSVPTSDERAHPSEQVKTPNRDSDSEVE